MFGVARLNTLAKAAVAAAVRTTITNSGTVTVDTAITNLGTGTAKFPGGNGAFLLTSDITETPITGDFTIEFFARMAATNGGSGYLIKNYNYTGASAYGTGAFQLYFSTSTQFIFAASGITNITGVIALNTWYHFAIVRSGSTLTIYRNGTSIGTATYTASMFASGYTKLLLGTYSESAETLNGNMDEIRVSNIARYTANFTTPSADRKSTRLNSSHAT
jgi:hypothetical protein